METFLILAILFGPLAFGAVEPWSLAILQILLFGLMFLVLLRGASNKGEDIRNSVLAAVAAILLLGLLQCLNPSSLTEPGAIIPFTADKLKSRQDVILWASYAALLWSAPQILCGRCVLRRLAWAIFLLGAVVAVVGLAQAGQGNNAYYGLRPVRQGTPFGPYANYNHAASLMVMSLFIGMGIFLARLDRLRRELNMGRLVEMSALLGLIAFLLAVIACGIWKTHSRGGMSSGLAAAWGICMLASCRIQAPRLRQNVRAVLFCAMVGYALFLYFHQKWIGFVFGARDYSTAYRLSMYRSGLSMLRDFPLFGIGLGGFQSAYPAYQEQLVHGVVEYAHNDWLELAVSVGLPGAMLYAGSLIFFLCRMAQRWLSFPSREFGFLAAGILAAILAFALHGFMEFSFQIPANAIIFLALLCLLEGSLSVA